MTKKSAWTNHAGRWTTRREVCDQLIEVLEHLNKARDGGLAHDEQRYGQLAFMGLVASYATRAHVPVLVRLARNLSIGFAERRLAFASLIRARHGGWTPPGELIAAFVEDADVLARVCECEDCCPPQLRRALPLSQVAALVPGPAFTPLLRRLEQAPNDELHLFLRHLRPSERPVPSIVYWTAERLAGSAVDPVDVAMRMRRLGVRHRALDAALDDVPEVMKAEPWAHATRIALRLDDRDAPYLDLGRVEAALGSRLVATIRHRVLQRSLSESPRGFTAMLDFLRAWEHGFRLTADMLDSMTLSPWVIASLGRVLLDSDRDAALRWIARRAAQPVLQPALRAIAALLARAPEASDREFLEAGLGSVRDEKTRESFRRAREKLDATVDLSWMLQRALADNGDTLAIEALLRHAPPLPTREQAIPWKRESASTVLARRLR
ncbi:MAG: hypothetical protein AAGE52_26135 [Myxococcota bacterium]